MGFFDRDVRDGFDAMFYFNHDGKLDFFEEAMQFDFIDSVSREDSDSDGDEQADELDEYGLDYDELESMGEDERREALEDAGLDPDDYMDDF